MACLQKTRKNFIVWPKDIAVDPASLAFEAIETIIWKLPIAPVVRIVSKYFETAGAIGTIRTIIWKPGLKYLQRNTTPRTNKELKTIIKQLIFSALNRSLEKVSRGQLFAQKSVKKECV